jgi:hypothetical protein
MGSQPDLEGWVLKADVLIQLVGELACCKSFVDRPVFAAAKMTSCHLAAHQTDATVLQDGA